MAQHNLQFTKVAQLQGHKDAIYDFALDAEQYVLYSAGADGYIVKWDLRNPGDGTLVLQTDQSFYSVYLDIESNLLYAGTSTGRLYCVDLKNATLLFEKEMKHRAIFTILKWKDEILLGYEDGVLAILNQGDYRIANSAIRAISPSNEGLIVGSSDNNIYLLDAELNIVSRLEGSENSVFALELNGEDLLYSSGRDARIRLWDLKIFKEVAEVPAHMYQVKSLSYRNGLLLSSSMDKTIKVWNTDLELIKVVDFARNGGHTNCINKVAWVDDRMCVSSSDDRSIVVWQVDNNP
ncbi:hypothetical protein GYB22_12950 [bacterium]|nr:hypothetical protein [bacterium]